MAVKDAHFQWSLLIQRGLKIPTLSRMETYAKNMEAIERIKQLVEQHYRNPVNGQF